MQRKKIKATDSILKLDNLEPTILPNEIMLMIFSYLLSKPKDLAQLSLVNKLWYCLASDNRLWTELSIKNGYGDPKKNTFGLPHEGKEYYRRIGSKVTIFASLFHCQSKIYPVDISLYETVEQFKDKLCEKLDTYRNPNSLFPRLKFAGTNLDNNKRLYEYDIQQGSLCIADTNRAGTQ